MRRPLVLVTTLAAELAVGTLALAPPASAQPTPDLAADQATVAPVELDPAPVPDEQTGGQGDEVPPPVRTGRSEPSPLDVPTDAPEHTAAVPAIVRSGRLDALAPDASTSRSGTPGSAIPKSAETNNERASAAPETPRGRADRSTSSSAPTANGPGFPTTAAPVPASPTLTSPTSTSHVVVAGEHLWSIATQQVAAAAGRSPEALTPADVVTYWVQLCMTNRPHLRSGNPSLVYPGEVLELPPTPPA